MVKGKAVPVHAITSDSGGTAPLFFGLPHWLEMNITMESFDGI
jgi:hypothetical protein